MTVFRCTHISALLACAAIGACGGGRGASVEVTEALASSIVTTRAPAPPAVLSPALPVSAPPVLIPAVLAPPVLALTPAGLDVVSEGDSISVFWGGNYTGIYAGSRPTVTFKGLAVGGSGLDGLQARSSAVRDLHPKVFTVLIGANDLLGHPSARDYVSALFAYTSTIRAGGAKVAVATILPQQVAARDQVNASHNVRRAEANGLIRAAVGREIDAVIDFAADPVMGPDDAASNAALYQDGIHPTGGCGIDCGGQGRLARVYKSAVDTLLATIGR